jgi:HlyD family secretion protein
MRNRVLFLLALLGLLTGLASAYFLAVPRTTQPPVFNPSPNPYPRGIYANGIIESAQSNGENINLFPEISGTISTILVTEGQTVARGAPLLTIDDSVQRAVVEQQRSQAEAALALLAALKAQPRRETLAVAQAQVVLARATLKTAQDQYDKQSRLYELDPKSVSKDTLDTAANAVKVATASVEVAQRQLDLTRAGAWTYDIENQERQYNALYNAYLAATAQLARYTIKAPADGTILSVRAAVGSYVSPQGTYSTYTGGFNPIVVMGAPQDYLAVRCYVDEILVPRIPAPARIRATMFIRGSNLSLPLEYVRTQPYVGPKIALSDQRAERVDVRVLPLIFRFSKPSDIALYPGQLVDVYIGEESDRPPR